MGKSGRRGSKRLRSNNHNGSYVNELRSAKINKREKKNKEPMGNISRLLKGMHKIGRGSKEILFNREFNLIEFVKNQS